VGRSNEDFPPPHPPSGGEEVSKEEMLVEEGAHALEAARTV